MSTTLRLSRVAAVAKFARRYLYIKQGRRQSLTTTTTNPCPDNVVNSPFAPIPEGPYPPFFEFLTRNWQAHGGTLRADRVAIIDGTTGLQRTWGDYHATAGSLAAVWRHDMELAAGGNGTVALYCPNHVDYLPVVLAASLCGAKLTPINPLYTTHELEVVLERSHASILVAHVSKLDNALKAAQQSPFVRHVIVMTDDDDSVLPAGTVALESLQHDSRAFYETARLEHDDTTSTVVSSINDQTLLLPYSSGTTGLPKGVCLSHNNIIVNLLQLHEIEKDTFLSHHKLISPLPFFHIYGFVVSLLYSAWKGQTLLTNSGRFDLEQYCNMVQTYKPERSHLVPPIILGLAKHPVVDHYDLSSLQVIVSAAAPLDQDLQVAVEQRLSKGNSKGLICKQAWGMSELSPVGTCNHDATARTGSVGPPVSNTQAKIVDTETGLGLGPRQPGELVIRGPQVMAGYLNEPERTAECLDEREGWLKTGDVAWYDDDGYFYITDRVKELIKVRGFPVAPAELEALLLRHEAINDVAVIPLPDEASGELPRAYIVVQADASNAEKVSEQDIYEWVKERVANYKRLDGGIVFTDSIPKSASGKILRRILRDQLEKELERNAEEDS